MVPNASKVRVCTRPRGSMDTHDYHTTARCAWWEPILVERAQPQGPGRDPGDAKEPQPLPGIGRQARTHVVGRLGPHDEQDVGRTFERAAENHEPLFLEGVHDGRVACPVSLA